MKAKKKYRRWLTIDRESIFTLAAITWKKEQQQRRRKNWSRLLALAIEIRDHYGYLLHLSIIGSFFSKKEAQPYHSRFSKKKDCLPPSIQSTKVFNDALPFSAIAIPQIKKEMTMQHDNYAILHNFPPFATHS